MRRKERDCLNLLHSGARSPLAHTQERRISALWVLLGSVPTDQSPDSCYDVTRRWPKGLINERSSCLRLSKTKMASKPLAAKRVHSSSPSVRFHTDIWLTLCVVNWLCDFGRPIASLAAPLEYFPLKYPSLGDYLHLVYNVLGPFCLLKLLERSAYKLSSNMQYLLVILFTIGASLHLVADTVDHRLLHLGYQNHLSVRENPLIKVGHACSTRNAVCMLATP